MKKIGISLITSIGILGLIGCGGGGSSSSTSTTTSSVSGVVEASKLAGVIVTDNKGHQTITDANGSFVLNGVAPGTKLYLKVNNAEIGSVEAQPYTIVNPLVLADGNSTLAAKIGVALHLIGGCSIAAEECNLSNAILNINKPLVEYLEENNTIPLENKEIEISDENISDYESAYPHMVKYSILYKSFDLIANKDLNITFDYTKNILSFDEETNLTLITNNEWSIDSHQLLFKDYNADNYFVITPSILLGVISDNGYKFLFPAISEPNKINDRDFNNTRFNVAIISPLKPAEFGVLEFNITTAGNKIFAYYTPDYGIGGTWNIENNTTLKLYDLNGNLITNVLAKKIENRIALSTNMPDGSIIFATKALDINATQLNGEKFYYVWDENITNPDSEFCTGYVTINGTTGQYKDTYCSDNGPEEGTFNLEYNPTIDINGTTYSLNGWIKMEEGNESNYVFMDPVLGIFIAPNGYSLNIGTNRVIK